MNIEYIKIFGERNCGTNYLQSLVRRNFKAGILPGKVNPALGRLKEIEFVRYLYFTATFSMYFGWKHAEIDAKKVLDIPKSRSTLFLIITKNPYAFLLSLFKRPYHYKVKKTDFDDFLSVPWETVWFERGPSVYPNPVALWNAKNRSYLSFAASGAQAEIIRYEDLLADTKSVFQQISEKFSLTKTPAFFQNVRQSMKGENQKDFNYYRDYYLHEKWREKLSTDQVMAINRHLDHETVKALGYRTLS